MIFKNIEILYNIFYLPIKIKYSEKRKLTFIEYFILTLIFDYPNKNENLEDILKNEFNIKNNLLFKRVLNELIDLNILKINIESAGVGYLKMETPIKNYKVDDSIKEEFINNKTVVSINEKFYDIKYSMDFISNKKEFIKKINYDRKINNAQYSYTIENNKLEILNDNIIELEEETKKFIKNNPIIFGDNSTLVGLFLNTYKLLKETNDIYQFIEKDNIVVEAEIEIIDNNKIKLLTNNIFVSNFLEKNLKIKIDIIENIFKKYSDKVNNIFKIKNVNVDKKNYFLKPNLVSDLNTKGNYNFLLVNDIFVESYNDLIKNKQLTKNINFIVFYNSKRNNNIINILDNKIVIYINEIKNELLNENSLFYVDIQNNFNGFLISQKNIQSINNSLPVFYLLKTENNILNLKEIFENETDSILENFNHFLLNEEYELAMNIYMFLERINLDLKAISYLEDHFRNTLREGVAYNKIKNVLSLKDNKKTMLTLEKIFTNLIINFSKKNDEDKFLFDIIDNHQLVEPNNVLKICKNIEIENNVDNIYKINKLLISHSIDGWKYNIRDSLIVLTNYFKNNIRENLFDENLFSSTYWIQNANTLNFIGKMIKSILNNNFDFVEKNYKKLLDKVIALMNEFVEIDNFKNYLFNISEILKEFYNLYNEYINKKIKKIDKDSINYKIILLANNYINELNDKINNLIEKKYFSMPVEVKIELIKYILNENEDIDKIIKNQSSVYKKALNIIYGEQKNYENNDYIKFKNIFGG